jgi:choline dehydrogenase-like flavoprotein
MSDSYDVIVIDHACLKNEIPVAGCAHQSGTVRFGNDPGSSVLDTDCKAHELDDLWVATSFFPSISGQPGAYRGGQ